AGPGERRAAAPPRPPGSTPARRAGSNRGTARRTAPPRPRRAPGPRAAAGRSARVRRPTGRSTAQHLGERLEAVREQPVATFQLRRQGGAPPPPLPPPPPIAPRAPRPGRHQPFGLPPVPP